MYTYIQLDAGLINFSAETEVGAQRTSNYFACFTFIETVIMFASFHSSSFLFI